MLRVILVDDEPLARLGMRQLLAAFPDIELAGEAKNAASAVELVRSEKPDAIFLDIHMPRVNGFDLLAGLENPPKVVFVTAHSEHAVRAFDVEAVDYLLKPVHPERLATAITRLESSIAAENAPNNAPRHLMTDRICFRVPGKTIVTPPDKICALRADGDFTRVFLTNEPPLLICQSLGRYERTLPNPPFLRLDRSLIINLERILKTESSPKGGMLLWIHDVAEPLALGRNAWGRLKGHIR